MPTPPRRRYYRVVGSVTDEKRCICTECSEECGIVEETFDYPGTHCTFGKSGTYHTGIYVSDCCLAEYDMEYYPGELQG